MSYIPTSKAGQIALDLTEKLVSRINDLLTDCNVCNTVRSMHGSGQGNEPNTPDPIDVGNDFSCWSCGKEWWVTKLGMVSKEGSQPWVEDFPNWISNPFNIACPNCANEGVLVVIVLRDDREWSKFNRNHFSLQCPRCDYNKPRHELEFGEHKWDLWYLPHLESQWALTATLEMWDGMEMPIDSKPYKSRNPGHGVD